MSKFRYGLYCLVKRLSVLFLTFFIVFSQHLLANEIISSKIPDPEVNDDSWVMIEIWPEIKEVTLATYFLDYSSQKNQNLCKVTKRVFDFEQESKAKASGIKRTSYRLCMSVLNARTRGFIEQ